MRIVEGEPYNSTRLELSKRRVNALGFFERVDVSEKRGDSDDKMEVNVEVTERQTGAFQIGAGFSSAENFIFQAQISQNNLFGRGQALSLQAMLSGLRQIFLLSFEEPYFLDTNWTFGFNLYNQFQYYPSFNRTSQGGSLTWGYMLFDNFHLYLRYQLEQVGVSTSTRSRFLSGGQRTPFPPGTLANLLRPGLSSSVRLSLTYDSRDNRLFPTSGWFNDAAAEFAEPIFFSQTRFTRYDVTSRYFYPLWGPFVLPPARPDGPGHQPRSAGGADLRALLRRRHLRRPRLPALQPGPAHPRPGRAGPRRRPGRQHHRRQPAADRTGRDRVPADRAGRHPGGGLQRRGQRLQPRAAILRPAAGRPRTSRIDPCVKPWTHPNSLRTSWGFGFRWFSPIGPLRFEWGLPFKPLRGEEPLIFEFTIGNDL